MIVNIFLFVIGLKIWRTLDKIEKSISTMDKCITDMHNKAERVNQMFDVFRRLE